jgi:enoyl-CoA hydratase/carnithine racemase
VRHDPAVRALIITGAGDRAFVAGADIAAMTEMSTVEGMEFCRLGHRVLHSMEELPIPIIAAVNGFALGGGLELALVCDLIIADKLARFCFPELRLGLIPGFGGIPRLKRDLGNAVVRDLLLTGRSFNATKAQQIGLVSQVVSEGEALRAARATAAQIGKFDRHTAATAKQFIKPIPHEELRREIDIFCDLFTRPAVTAGLKKFVESTDAQPYLP